MKPFVSWLDLTGADRDRMRKVLSLFDEQGTLDEMGLGVLRDAFSDALFPGTSSIQTRIRYALFVPWIYQRLAEKRVSSADVAARARRAELSLIAPLKASGDALGVFGSGAGLSLKRLPSTVYWGALARWGIFLRPLSQAQYHDAFSELNRRRGEPTRPDDPGVTWSRPAVWHPRLPPVPDGFPADLDFALTATEARFLQSRLATQEGSLLAWWALEGRPLQEEESFWALPERADMSEVLRGEIELARRFALHVHGAPILYNLMLAEQRGQDGDSERVGRFRERLKGWAEEVEEDGVFELEPLWSFADRRRAVIKPRLRSFVAEWVSAVERAGAANIADDAGARRLVREREIGLKRGRSRFTNAGRLQDWGGASGTARMDYRWGRVRQLMNDLHAGLARSEGG